MTDIAEALGSKSKNEGDSKHFFFFFVILLMVVQIVLIIRFQLNTTAKRRDLKSEVQVFTIEKSIPLSFALAIVSL